MKIDPNNTPGMRLMCTSIRVPVEISTTADVDRNADDAYLEADYEEDSDELTLSLVNRDGYIVRVSSESVRRLMKLIDGKIF